MIVFAYDYPLPRGVLVDARVLRADRLDRDPVPGDLSTSSAAMTWVGWGKALWVIFVIVLPFLGMFVYLIARCHSMADRDRQDAQAKQQAFQAYVRQAANSGGGTADELSKLTDLKAQGVISDAEFEQKNAKLLA
jgi:Short C-terminal domain